MDGSGVSLIPRLIPSHLREAEEEEEKFDDRKQENKQEKNFGLESRIMGRVFLRATNTRTYVSFSAV